MISQKTAVDSSSASACTTSPPARCCGRSEEHTSELQSQSNLACRLLLEKKKHRPRSLEIRNELESILRFSVVCNAVDRFLGRLVPLQRHPHADLAVLCVEIGDARVNRLL